MKQKKLTPIIKKVWGVTEGEERILPPGQQIADPVPRSPVLPHVPGGDPLGYVYGREWV